MLNSDQLKVSNNFETRVISYKTFALTDDYSMQRTHMKQVLESLCHQRWCMSLYKGEDGHTYIAYS